MSKIKLTGHASGTGVLTVTAPNTSTDRTITLPDESVTLGAAVGGANGVDFNDNVKARFGTGNDFAIWHDGSHTRFQNDTGNLNVRANVFNVTKSDDSENIILAEADGDVKLYRNNVIHLETLATGVRVPVGGVLFGTDTAAANALDDYEEGSFTPVFTGSSGSAGSYDTGEHEARYTKVGRLVTIHWKITLTNKGSWSGEVRFTGLPFTPAFTLNGAGSIELLRVNYAGGSVGNVNAYVTASQTYWRPRYTHDNDQANMVQVSECVNNSAFGGTLSYIVA